MKRNLNRILALCAVFALLTVSVAFAATTVTAPSRDLSEMIVPIDISLLDNAVSCANVISFVDATLDKNNVVAQMVGAGGVTSIVEKKLDAAQIKKIGALLGNTDDETLEAVVNTVEKAIVTDIVQMNVDFTIAKVDENGNKNIAVQTVGTSGLKVGTKLVSVVTDGADENADVTVVPAEMKLTIKGAEYLNLEVSSESERQIKEFAKPTYLFLASSENVTANPSVVSR